MDHTVKEPLNVDLDLSSQSKPIQSFVGADIAEYRLYDCHTLGVDLMSFFTLDLLLLPLQIIDLPAPPHGCIGGKLAALQCKKGPSEKIHLLTD